jgi:hypothetical protein
MYTELMTLHRSLRVQCTVVQVDLPEDPNLRELTSAKPAFINTPKDGNSPRSEPSGRASLTDGGECGLALWR